MATSSDYSIRRNDMMKYRTHGIGWTVQYVLIGVLCLVFSQALWAQENQATVEFGRKLRRAFNQIFTGQDDNVGAFPFIEPGMEYINHRIGDKPWSIHVLKIERSGKYHFISTLANEVIPGLVTVRGQIESLSDESGRPIAAVNGDFFHIRPGLYQGDPLGLHIAKGELTSAPTGTSFWIDTEGKPRIGEVMSKFRATCENGMNIPFGLNEARSDNAAVLYTPIIGESTRTSSGIELTLKSEANSEWLPLRAGLRYQAKVAAINNNGNTTLAPDVMVLSIGPALAERLPVFEVGTTISLSLATSPDLKGARIAIGGGPVLVKDGKPIKWRSKPIRHPRTAVGFNSECMFLIVVDGRQEKLSAGMNYPELADMMIRLGCREGMNLDGGGSSTFWLGGQVLNSPSDGAERKVANSLIVVAREQQTDEDKSGAENVTSK